MTRALVLVPILAALAAAPAFAAETAKPATAPPAAAAAPHCPGLNAKSGQGMMHGSGGLGRPNMTPEQRQAMIDAHKGMMGGKGGAAVSPQNCPGMAQAPAPKPEPKPEAK